MHIKLEINAESVEEFDAAVARFAPKSSIGGGEWGGPIKITPEAARGSTAAEAESPLEPKQTRQRKPKDEPTATTSPAPSVTTEEEPAASDEHPMLTPKTLAEVKALGNKKVSELGAGPIQQALIENFQVKAFGGLDPADYDRAYAILGALK